MSLQGTDHHKITDDKSMQNASLQILLFLLLVFAHQHLIFSGTPSRMTWDMLHICSHFQDDKKNDTQIFALAILLSSTFVYNTMNKIDQGAIDLLQYPSVVQDIIGMERACHLCTYETW